MKDNMLEQLMQFKTDIDSNDPHFFRRWIESIPQEYDQSHSIYVRVKKMPSFWKSPLLWMKLLSWKDEFIPVTQLTSGNLHIFTVFYTCALLSSTRIVSRHLPVNGGIQYIQRDSDDWMPSKYFELFIAPTIHFQPHD